VVSSRQIRGHLRLVMKKRSSQHPVDVAVVCQVCGYRQSLHTISVFVTAVPIFLYMEGCPRLCYIHDVLLRDHKHVHGRVKNDGAKPFEIKDDERQGVNYEHPLGRAVRLVRLVSQCRRCGRR